jgi:hypothetical protein
MIEKALKFITDFLDKRDKAQTIHEDYATKTVLVNGVEKTFNKTRFHRDHMFFSVAGLMDYLKSKANESTSDEFNPGVVFVGVDSLQVDMQYGSNETHVAKMPLGYSEEYKALRQLMNDPGVAQKKLWKLLITALADSMDKSLLLSIQNIKVNQKSDSNVEINALGVSNASASRSLQITYPGKNGASENAEIPVDWTFKGRIFEAFDKEYEIPLRLEVHTDDGMTFQFHPRRLEKILTQCRLDLVDVLQAQVPSNFTVHEGRL